MILPSLTRRRALVALPFALSALSALACADRAARSLSDTAAVQATAQQMSVVAEAAMARDGRGLALTASRRHEPKAQQARPASRPRSARATSMIIRTGEVSVLVDSLEVAMDAVRQLAASLGGFIGNASITAGEHQLRTASLEIRIHPNRFDEAMAGMRPLGKVQHASTSAQDVGEEFVDVTARIANGKRLEERLVNLLASRTAKLADVLTVERELARVREEIELQEGRLRYIGAHVATSTIVATVHEKAPIVAAHPGANPIRKAFVNLWRNFVFMVAFGIEALGVVIPFAAVGILMVWGWRRLRRPATPLAAPFSGQQASS